MSLLILILAGCRNLRGDPDNSVSQADPETGSCRLTVAPGWVDFGSLEVASLTEPVQQELVFKNEGDALCEISDVRLSGESEHFSLEITGDMNLEPGLLSTVLVSYWPVTAAEDSVSVIVESNDSWTGDLEVPLDGEGLAPRLEISPSELDLGGVELGCQTSQELAIRNTGNRNLVIDAFRYSAESEELRFVEDHNALNGPLPWTLKPGDNNPVWVEFHPIAEGEITGSLFMDSNDPLNPTLMATQTGTGVINTQVQDSFVVELQPPVDIVFAVDFSDSLWDVHSALINGLPDLVDALEQEGLDYHIAYLLNDDGCVVGSEPYIHSGQLEAAQSELVADQLCTDEPPGTCSGSNTERAFMLVDHALSNANLATGGCNEGLIREAASLTVVGVSNEEEQSVQEWDHYVQELQDTKADPDNVKVFGIGGPSPSGCSGPHIEAELYSGIYEASQDTDGALYSICEWDKYSSYMEGIAAGAAPDRSIYTLTQLPVLETLVVSVEGSVRVSGWSYDAESNSVVFADDSLPARGAEVLVDYAVAGECPE